MSFSSPAVPGIVLRTTSILRSIGPGELSSETHKSTVVVVPELPSVTDKEVFANEIVTPVRLM